jgi:hypothetical protein
LETLAVPREERRCPSAFERFSAEFGEALDDYSCRLRELDVDLLVAISRKGPRLLQLMTEIPDVSDPDLSTCVSEKALPYLPRDLLEGASIGVTDDTIAYGSTFARNFGALRDAGAQPRGEVLAMSQMASQQARGLLASDPLLLPEVEIRRLIDLEIQAFGALAVPYDIDHPIFTVAYDGEMSRLAEELEHEWPEARRPSNPWHEASDVIVLSLPAPELVLGSHSQATRRLGPQKLRLFLDSERRAVRAVAIFALALRESELRDPELFAGSPAALGEAWQILLDAVDNAAWPARSQHLALVNAAHYLAGCEALWLWFASTDLGLDSIGGRISELDLRLLFGPTAAASIHPPVQKLLQEASTNVPPKPAKLPPTPEVFDPEAEIEALLADERGRAFATHAPEHLKMAAPYDPNDLIHALFNAQRRTYDEETRNYDGIEVERLSLGLLPFPVVVPLLARFGAGIEATDFDHFADLAIDGGSIVPHYTAALSQPDLWLRSVRAGERDSEKLKHWLHGCVEEAQRAFERTHRIPEEQRGVGVPWYVVEKLLAIVSLCLGKELTHEFPGPVTCGRDEFGARAVLPDIPTSPYLLNWGTDIGLLERHPEREIVRRSGAVASGVFVTPSKAFRDLYPEDRDVVERMLAHPSRAIIDAMIAIEATLQGKRRDLALLAISSCGSYRAYLESLSAEVQVWLHSRRANPHGLAVRMEELAAAPNNRGLANVISRSLGLAARTVAQTGVKRNAYEWRVAARDAIDALVETDDLCGAHYVTWEQYLRPLIKEEKEQEHPAERYLIHASELAGRATSIARTVLSEHRLIQVKKGDLDPLARQVERYREILADSESAGLHFSRPEPEETALLDQDPAVSLHAAARLLAATEGAVRQIWDTWRQPGPPSPIQAITGSHALLMWDVVDSSSVDPHILQDTIHRVNERVRVELNRHPDTPYYPDQNDCKAAILPTATIATEMFTTVAELFGASGISIRAGIETTADGRYLSVNRRTGEFAGSAYVVAKRTMDAFEELAADKTECGGWRAADGGAPEMEAPEGSHLLLTERAMKGLREHEGANPTRGLDLHGIIEDYVPRYSDSLSLDVHCFSVTTQ